MNESEDLKSRLIKDTSQQWLGDLFNRRIKTGPYFEAAYNQVKFCLNFLYTIRPWEVWGSLVFFCFVMKGCRS